MYSGAENSMYTSDPSGQLILSSMNLQRFERLVGGGRLISGRISYRNHYMCSGEATSIIKDMIALPATIFIVV